MNVPRLTLINRPATRCSSCGEHFPVRRGRTEVLVGLDGRLYCYAMKTACAIRAIKPTSQSGTRSPN
jgi:hypothetical protein